MLMSRTSLCSDANVMSRTRGVNTYTAYVARLNALLAQATATNPPGNPAPVVPACWPVYHDATASLSHTAAPSILTPYIDTWPPQRCRNQLWKLHPTGPSARTVQLGRAIRSICAVLRCHHWESSVLCWEPSFPNRGPWFGKNK